MSDLLNPNDYGVLPTGFSRMRFPEIRQQIITTLQTTTGLTFETRPDSITGQFISVFAEREATLWELAEAVYHSMYPISAYGISLDHAVSFAGVRRLFAESSNAWIVLYGTEGTTVFAGSFVRNEDTQDDFAVRENVNINRNNSSDITLSVDTAVVGQRYWISINSVIYQYVCQSGDQPVNIAARLGLALLSTGLEQTIDANKIRLNEVDSIPFQCQFFTPDISLIEIGSPGFCDAVNSGPVDVTAGKINQIVTLLPGWDRVNNLVNGYLGRDLETDEELRLRYNTGVYRLGAATLPALKANLIQNIPGIISLEVFENEEDVTDDEGRVPHSIEVVAYGGDAQQIGEQIFALKAAGIDTNGLNEVNVTDNTGFVHVIKFNRPTPVFFWVKVVVTLYDEEQFPYNGPQQIQAIITETGNSFGVGKDVILQRFLGSIYSNVAGIARIDITVAYESDGNTIPAPGDYTAQNVVVAARELSQFDATRVQVTVNTL